MSPRFTASCLAFVLFLWEIAASATAGDTRARAGWAQVDITPPLGIAMGGRGGNYVLAKQVLDPLYAQIVYMQDAKGTGFVLVSFDLVGLPHSLSDQIRQSLVYELGVDWNLILLNSSHTHSGPNMLREILAGVGPAPEIEVAYFAALKEKVVLAAREAKKKVVPIAEIKVYEGKSNAAINRRGRNKQGNVGILPDPSGPIDEQVWAMRITPEGNTPGALIFSYSCHPVIVYGYAFATISADFPGEARKELLNRDQKLNHVQFVQGFAGNVRPRSVADLEKLTFRGGNPEKLRQTGAELANDVLVAVNGKGERLTLDFAAASDRPFLPRGEPPVREVYEKMSKETGSASNQYTRAVAEFWLKRYDSGEGFAKGDAWPLGVVRLDRKHYIVHMAGEPTVEWRPLIAKWLTSKKVVTFGYMQEANTYLPTENLLKEGGYEVIEANRARMSSPAPFAPGIEAAIRTSVLRQLAYIEAPVEDLQSRGSKR